MSKVKINEVEYECPSEVAQLLQEVSIERDDLQLMVENIYSIPKSFNDELKDLINRYSVENHINMPDFILADMICRMIEVMGISIKKNLNWHGLVQFDS